MATEVETKDCTALTDAEIGEMADICVDGAAGIDVGLLSKQREAWVLVTQARDSGRLAGFSFCTLERIGGTPSLLVGVASVRRNNRRETVLRAIMADQYRRALLAFPDEDVLVGTRMGEPGAFQAFRGLEDVVPRPGHRATGEERAWGRRLAKRFGSEGRLDDRTFVLTGDGCACGLLDHTAAKAESVAGLEELFAPIDVLRRDVLVAFGWAMAEDLASGRLCR